MSINSFDDYPMSWRPDLSRAAGPKYLALADLLEADIRSGALKGGTKLPPQRELADFLDINLSTVSRAFKLCERRGLLSASVGNGTYVSSGVTAEPVLLCGNRDARVIEMGAIVPAASSNERVKNYMQKLLKAPDARSLFSYGPPEGAERHREAGAAWMERSGFHTDAAHIVLAAGGQNALCAALGTLFEPGDKVGVDPLTYPGIKTAAKLLGVHLIPIQNRDHEMTEDGILYAVQNENIKGIYVMPDFHNPTTRIMSLRGRKMIAEMAVERGLLVIEDGLNNLLEEMPAPPIASFAPGHIVYLSSVSKTIAAGLRTAFIHVPEPYRQRLVEALYSMNISVSPLLAAAAAGLIEDGIADEIIAERKRDIIARNHIVDEVLAGVPIAGARTCPLRYIQLPASLTGEGFERRAWEAGVQVYGAEHFVIGNQPAPNTARISVTTPAALADLSEGLERLRGILK